MHCSHAETATRTGTPENGKPPLLKLETPFFSTKASDAVNGMRLHKGGHLLKQNVFGTHCVGFSWLAAHIPHVLITSSSHPGLVTGAQGCCAPVVCLCLLHPSTCHLHPVLLLTIFASGFRSRILLASSPCVPSSPLTALPHRMMLFLCRAMAVPLHRSRVTTLCGLRRCFLPRCLARTVCTATGR